jgi:hypothetical protein
LGIVDAIVIKILSFLTITTNPSDYADLITLSTIQTGSVSIVGSVTPTNPSTDTVVAASNAVGIGLSNTADIGGYQLSAASVSTVGVESSESNLNLPLILGLAIGIPCLISNY